MVPQLVAYVTPAVIIGAVILAGVAILILRRCYGPKQGDSVLADVEKGQNFTYGAHRRLHQVTPDHHHGGGAGGVKKGKSLGYSPFRWDDHPSLINDAVENGWSRFAFTIFGSLPLNLKPTKAFTGVADQPGVAIGWEVSDGSYEYVQRIQLNPTKESTMSSSVSAISVIRTTLPLPGPNLGNTFPQEAYFEITLLSFNDHRAGFFPNGETEGDKVKPIALNFNSKSRPENLNISTSDQRTQTEDAASISVGLCGGGPLRIKFPGTYPGSIGFNSDGCVYLGNNPFGSREKFDWKESGRVVGCGFNPAQRKVFFTVDGRLAHEIICTTEEFAAPLYPTLAANTNVTLTVNLGQRKFLYDLANIWRTRNPCRVKTPEASPILEDEDCLDLFSMEEIDSDYWKRRNAAVKSTNIRNLEYDQESEGELFEIPLDGVTAGVSPFRASANYR